jgi:hypothetical protein
MRSFTRSRWAALAIGALPLAVAVASSHREAPFITEHPKVDGTDFTCFAATSPAAPGT